MAHEITSPKNQPQVFLMTMRQYWLGKTKPKQGNPKCFQQVDTEFKNIYILIGIFKKKIFNRIFY